MRDIHLRSGKWRWSADPAAPLLERLELIDPAAPGNKMLVPAPEDRSAPLDPERLERMARDPDVRLWTDEFGIQWRISRVGPDSHYPYAFHTPHLVFDSEETFAGIVEIDPFAHLGELLDDELRRYRDRMRDFGARRRAFRPPTHTA